MESKFALTCLSAALTLSVTGCFSPSGDKDFDAEMESGGSDGAMDAGVDGDDDGVASADDAGDDGMDDAGAADDDAGDDGADDDSTGEVVDTESPTVLMTSPEDADNGVLADAPLVITFSEPMDKAATQVAIQSANISLVGAEMLWNDAGDELTVVPTEPLVYAEGVDPAKVVANTYNFNLSTAATDLAGNELDQAVDVEFETYRRIGFLSYMLGSMTGSLRGDDTHWLGGMFAGDTANGHQWWSVTSVPLYDLPEGIEHFESVLLRLHQAGNFEDPLDLGVLHLYDVEYASFGDPALEAPMLDDLGAFSNDYIDGWHELEVADAVQADYDAGHDLAQFALQFAEPSNLDGVEDVMFYSGADGEQAGGLIMTYLIP